MRIPKWWDANDRVYYAQLSEDTLSFSCERLNFFVEPTLDDFFHPCTPGEILEVLGCLPRADWFDIKNIVLRQPTRKQSQLHSVWGRMVYSLDLGGQYGPSIVLDAQHLRPLIWTKRLGPHHQRELERLERDGHRICLQKRAVEIQVNPESIRTTQLYHTVPHEVGHYVDYLEKVERRSEENAQSWSKLWELYCARPTQEKEDFAIAYAERHRPKLEGPFRAESERRRAVLNFQLKPAWFGL